jgi:hypothetical protein
METNLEWILTNSIKADMIAFIAANPVYFEELIQLALTPAHPCSWRASWLLWSCMEKNDHRVRKHQEEIIHILRHVNDNQQRELLLVLQNMEIDSVHQGRLFDLCIDIWKQTYKKPSIRYNAFRVMYKIALENQDLSNELKMLSGEEYLESLSSTVRKAIRRMIN